VLPAVENKPKCIYKRSHSIPIAMGLIYKSGLVRVRVRVRVRKGCVDI
jgi:hypothetical protein